MLIVEFGVDLLGLRARQLECGAAFVRAVASDLSLDEALRKPLEARDHGRGERARSRDQRRRRDPERKASAGVPDQQAFAADRDDAAGDDEAHGEHRDGGEAHLDDEHDGRRE